MRSLKIPGSEYWHVKGQELFFNEQLCTLLGIRFNGIRDITYIVPVNHILDIHPLEGGHWDEVHEAILTTVEGATLQLVGTYRPGWWIIKDVR